MKTLVLLFGLLLALPPAGSAQTSDAVADSLVIEFRSVIGRAEQLSLLRLSLTGEDSLIVLRQTEQEVVRAARVLQDLSRELAPDPDNPPALDSTVVAEFTDLAAKLWGAESHVRERLDETRARVFAAQDSDARRLERQLGERERRMSLVYEVLTDHVLAMERVGIEAVDHRRRLIEVNDTRAIKLSARIDYLQSALGELEDQAAAFPDDTSLVDQIHAMERRRVLYLQSLTATIRRLDDLDQPTAEYQNVVVRNTGDIAKTLLDPGIATSLFRDWWAAFEEWMADNGLGLLVKVLFFVFIIGLSWAAARAVRKAVEHGLSGPRVRISHLLRKMIIAFSGNLVLVTGFLIALSQTGVNLSPILAGFGVVGFIVGFALQDTLANFAAGMMILFYRPYDVGDLVEVSGVFGTVNQMSLVSTTILTIDHQTLVVPNGKIWGDVIRNVTAQNVRRVDLVFGIGYAEDIPKAEKILMSILQDHDKVLSSPEPMVRLHKLNESSVDFVVRPWVKTEDYWDVHWDVTREVKMRFDAEGISIPFPQRDVHHYVDGAPARGLARISEDGGPARPAGSSGIAADGEAEFSGDQD